MKEKEGLRNLTFNFKSIGDNDRTLAQKSDIVRISYTNNSFCISCYQLNYQALANHQGSTIIEDTDKFLIPVSKILLDTNGFNILCNEIDNIKAKINSNQGK